MKYLVLLGFFSLCVITPLIATMDADEALANEAAKATEEEKNAAKIEEELLAQSALKDKEDQLVKEIEFQLEIAQSGYLAFQNQYKIFETIIQSMSSFRRIKIAYQQLAAIRDAIVEAANIATIKASEILHNQTAKNLSENTRNFALKADENLENARKMAYSIYSTIPDPYEAYVRSWRSAKVESKRKSKKKNKKHKKNSKKNKKRKTKLKNRS